MTSRQTKYTGWLIHAMVWAIVIFTPMFKISPDRPFMTGQEYVRFLLVPLSFMIVFYVNYLVLIDRYLSKRRMGLFILFNVLLIAVVMSSVHAVFRYILPPGMHHPPTPRPLWDSVMFFFRNAMLYVLTVGAGVAIKMTAGMYRSEAERKELEHSRSEAELQNLRNQINPHFLFNTLNNIYSLISIDTGRAQTAVHDLSHLLRYVLYGSGRQLVPLSEEMNFLKEYIGLMRLRLPGSVRVSVVLPEDSGTMIAPLLFISLIENAFKHGVSDSEPSFIDISVTMEDGMAVCRTANSFFPKSPLSDHSGSGIGLANLSRRLEMLYPGRYRFEYGRVGDEYRTCLSIKLQDYDTDMHCSG